MQFQLDPRFYYLSNFHKALAWLQDRYDDLLIEPERVFLRQFAELEVPAQALLVRMIMRKGPHFRASKLDYAEIGCPRRAAQPLLAAGWISDAAELSLEALFALLRKDELLEHLNAQAHKALKKAELFERLAEPYCEPQPFARWCPGLDEQVLTLHIGELCERLRLMFFGNLHQDWTEFVLADLGIFRYENVELSADSRGFRRREDVDSYLHLRRCQEHFEAGAPIAEVLALIGEPPHEQPFLARRHAKLLFRLGQQLERAGDLEHALACYAGSHYPGARQRQIRVLERSARPAEAFALAQVAAEHPQSEAEAQLLERALLRLGRQLGVAQPAKPRSAPAKRIDLCLPRPEAHSVEFAVKAHLHTDDAPVHYVENSLICSLFGLLCWQAIFAPLPGAFFHPFHTGPVDLLSADFHSRRAERFAACLAQLDSPAYKQTIRQTYADKYGIQSPFVFWAALDQTLLEHALECLPAAHLRAWFGRLLLDIKANRAGMPDLIQFWPAERRYRMIEVKGPGDRLQDNQRRWLAFCAEHGMPVDVCYVQWAEA
ncbi:VRR-NUC domain-containing protein [Pseudomonas sp. UBA2684]|uniref:VRR-NUC domain-containing protein n=1 Tax=Pseudomonas sp. UBA2684 TaxID=1947311 RepID=UPI000E8C6720|nr:VRR-NUC domain-containing protein [Pseudomonas sp. UBA2684]HBX57591.1 nuclease [Pseudomonas sp.]|tara:strand:+ start:11448 stop:13085 length:1638 start_codon:yes stop_codon:yes gene_type:complete